MGNHLPFFPFLESAHFVPDMIGLQLILSTRIVSSSVRNVVVPVAVDDEVSVPRQYRLLSTINNSGTLDRGHYTAYAREPSECWWFWNDKATIPASVQNVRNSNSYLFFYEWVNT